MVSESSTLTEALLGLQGAFWQQLHTHSKGVPFALALSVRHRPKADLSASCHRLARLQLHLTDVKEQLLVQVAVHAPAQRGRCVMP